MLYLVQNYKALINNHTRAIGVIFCISFQADFNWINIKKVSYFIVMF